MYYTTLLIFYLDGYNQLRIGMTYATVVASSKSDFSVVSALTDGYIPACNAWVGDYPYLQKKLFRRYVANESVDHVVNRREPDKTISTDYTSDNKVANAKKGGDFANEYDGSDY